MPNSRVIVRSAVNWSLALILSFSSWIVPKKNNLILLTSGYRGRFKGNPKYFFLYILEKNCDTYWLTLEKNTYNRLKSRGYPVVYRNSLKGFLITLRAKFIVIDDNSKIITYSQTLSLFRKLNIIELWHGIPMKNIEMPSNRLLRWASRKNNRSYKMIVGSSEFTRVILEERFENKNVKITGLPRNDIFFDKTLSIKKYEEEYNLSECNEVLLYAPTWRDENTEISPFSREFLEKLNGYLKQNDKLLLIKAHPRTDNIDVEQFSNIKDLSTEVDDIQELLIHTDILITDYSSVFLDFILTDRPVIFYPYDYEYYNSNCRELLHDYYDDFMRPFPETEKELLETIKNIDGISQKESYKQKYAEVKEKFHDQTKGSYSENVYSKLQEL